MSTHRSPALFRRNTFTRLQPSVARVVAIFLLVLSWLGTLIWGGGGWETWSTLQPSMPGLALGVVLQTVCTAVQWVYSDRWGSPWYILAVSASTGSTVAGFFPLTLLGLPLLDLQPVDTAWWGTLALTGLAGLLLDILPERILVAD